MSMFSQIISSKPPNTLIPNLVLWYIIMSRSTCRKIASLFSRSRSQQGLIWSDYNSFYCIFWTADPFASKLVLIVHYHKLECCMEKLDFCVQGQGHRKISKCYWMFVQMIPSELLNLLQPNLVGCCIILSHIVFQKDWFAVFKVRVTLKDRVIKIWLSNMSSELLNLWN